MKTCKYSILCVPALLAMMTSCYEDKGNYDYSPINEIQVEGLEKSYAVDVYDTLKISPKLTGTLYSDTTRFSYAWEIGGQTVSTSHDLNLEIDMAPGNKYSRFIVTDRQTNVKTYNEFSLNVSSSTAGDLIVILSKYQGRAELSYLRLDKPAYWQVNYMNDRDETPLGSDPQQLAILYTESARNTPFVNRYGRVMAVVDDICHLIDKTTMLHDTVTQVLNEEAYLQLISYPRPEISSYKTQHVNEGIGTYRKSPYGNSAQMSNNFIEISDGKLFSVSNLAPSVWTAAYYYDVKSPYKNGYLSPFGYWDSMEDTPDNNLKQAGYDLGDYIVFDQNVGRFGSASTYGSFISSIEEDDIHAFLGYRMIWGSATNRPGTTSVAVLANGDACRLVMLQNGKNATTNRDTKKLVAEVGCGNVMNDKSRFYIMKYNDNMFFSKGNTMYRYNIMNISSGTAPSEKDKMFSLTDFGYDASAVITDFCMSRSERTLLVGVSRYGSDTEGLGDEAKGDLLYFDVDKGAGTVTYNAEKSHKGVAGIPVDVEIKYQTHHRNGLNFDGILVDNI